MSRQTLLIGILIALVAGAAGYWYINHQGTVEDLSLEEVATTTAINTVQETNEGTGDQNTAVYSNLEFDPATVQPGEKFGAFTVTHSVYWPDESYSVAFRGPVTIRGTLLNTDPGMCDVMLEVSQATLATLPRVSGTEVESTKFYLNQEGLPESERATYAGARLTTRPGLVLQEGDTLEVVVDTLRKSYQGKDCSGNRIEVTSIKKVSI